MSCALGYIVRAAGALFPAAFCIALAAAPDGRAVYKQRCAVCHEASGETRAPSADALRRMSADNVLHALDSGLMRQQAAALTPQERRAVAEFVTGKRLGEASASAGACGDPKTAFAPDGAAWNGWGAGLANARFQAADRAGLDASQVPRLKLKWAFAFPNTFVAYGQPVVVGGRVFVPSANRNVYSLDARSGCSYWSFTAEAAVRTAITIATVTGERTRHVAFFGDQRGNAYALDASSGELLWKIRIDDHPRAKIVGAAQYYDGRLYVPLTAGEEGPAMDPKYECCSGRGGLVALDARTGKQIWKTYTIAEVPRPTAKSRAGTQLWGPSGASIWSAPTIDTERKLIYAATGDNFSDPATKTSDAVLAFDMASGKIVWSTQLTEADVFTVGCVIPTKANCPESPGPDFDIGASPILVTLTNGKRVLLVSQKSGIAHGLDPDNNGAILWQTRIGRGGTLGGIQWGSASDGQNMYAAVSDISFIGAGIGSGRRPTVDPKAGGGLFALDAATGKKVWAAAPPSCGDRPSCSPAQSAAVSAIPGVVFSGAVDGHLRGYSTRDGSVIWDFDTTREFTTVNGLTASGGAMDGPGPAIAAGMLYVSSGYGAWGGLPGNVLLAFSVDGK